MWVPRGAWGHLWARFSPREAYGIKSEIPGMLRRKLKAAMACAPLPVWNSAPECLGPTQEGCSKVKCWCGVFCGFLMVPLSHLQSPCDREGILEQPHVPCGAWKSSWERGNDSTWGHSFWENKMDRWPNPANLSQAQALWEWSAKKLFFCWIYCWEVVSLDLLGSHMGPESIAHMEGRETERWRLPEVFSL